MCRDFVLFVLFAAAAAIDRSGSVQVPESDASISVNLDSPLRTVSDQFLSVTLGPTDISKNWANSALNSKSLINMGKALSPALLRVGGTDEDYVTFKLNQSEVDNGMANFFNWTNFTLSASQWDALNDFSKEAGWDMVYGLNSLLRNPWPHGKWDTTNAEELFKYTISKGYDVSWELGNEPDLYSEGTKITTEQLAEDFKMLKQLLAELNMTSKYLAGPDVATLSREGYLEGFLKSLDKGVINAVTWHQYYTNGHTAKLSDFIDVKLLDHLIDEAKAASETVEKYQPGAELWLGETSNTYGGGTPGISDTYVAGFMWLDKLGLAAIFNHTRVMRQDFFGYNYGLVDQDGTPLPDFWLSALYKKLVGTKILNVEGSTSYGRNVRVYAHCAKSLVYPDGDVVLILLNMNNMTTSVTLRDTVLSSSSRDVYWLTPPGGTSDLQSRQVTLNGDMLKLTADAATLPDLTPQQQAAGDTLQLPPLSFGFYVFNNVKAKACIP